MATTDFTVANILDLTASLMNDTAKTKYTYTAMLPYFNMALAMMQEHLELSEIPVMEKSAVAITVTAGASSVVAGPLPTNYPTDLISIQQMWERLSGSSDPYTPMYKRNYLPHYLDGIETSDLVYWTWINQEIQFHPATTDREIKLDYIKQFFANTITNPAAIIHVMNSRTYLEFKTAALCARFIGENPTRGGELDGEAEMAKDRLLAINVKDGQDVQTRRKPFMAGYKQR